MSLNMNLNAAAAFSVPGGFPVRLWAAGDPRLSGVIPRGIASVTASVQTETAKANVHLALVAMPTTNGGGDGAVIAQTDLVATTTLQSMTVTVPISLAPACYVVRLWVDGITGSTAETVSRDGVTAASRLPNIPAGVKVASVVVA